MPSFLLGVNYLFVEDNSSSSESGKDAIIASLGVTVPIFRDKYNSEITSSTIKIEQLRKVKEDKLNSMSYKYGSYKLKIENQTKQIKLYEELIKIKTNEIEILKSSSSSSLINFERILEFIDKKIYYEIKKIDAESNRLNAFYNIKYLNSQVDVIDDTQGEKNENNR